MKNNNIKIYESFIFIFVQLPQTTMFKKNLIIEFYIG